MKVFIFFIGLTFSQLSFGTLFLSNTELVNLRTLSSEVKILVGYPGSGYSGVCSLEIASTNGRTEETLKNILNVITIEHYFTKKIAKPDLITNHILRLHFEANTYVDGFIFKTKNGKSLDEEIQKIVGNQIVIIKTRTCDGSFF